MPTAPGPSANPVCVGGFRAGGVAPRATGGGACHPKPWRRVTRVTPPCHCEGVRSTLKTLAYACGNPVIICLRAFARSAFLFTGSPRSFHSLAMTKGTKCPNTHHSCHSRAGGNRAWVVISYLIGGIILCCIFIYLQSAA